MCLADSGDRILLPDPCYPDYFSGLPLAEAELGLVPLDPTAGFAPDLDATPGAAALFLNYPTNPCAVCEPPGTFEAAVAYANRTGTVIVHDAAYIDLVFDGRAPVSFLATPGAKEVGVELFTMSKSYGMAGWRIGFVVGNAEIVERVNLMGDHSRVGIFMPLQEAAIAALEGPEDHVEERRASYERRRDTLFAALPEPPVCEGTFYVWLRLPEGLPADKLLADHGVALAPGGGFGASGEGWARLSLAVSDETLARGIERLAPALAAAYA
jgi:aminotransferase